jgi:hypothetical protein
MKRKQTNKKRKKKREKKIFSLRFCKFFFPYRARERLTGTVNSRSAAEERLRIALRLATGGAVDSNVVERVGARASRQRARHGVQALAGAA